MELYLILRIAVLRVFGFAAWIINISALSALQNDCSEGQLQIVRPTKPWAYMQRCLIPFAPESGHMQATLRSRWHLYPVSHHCCLALDVRWPHSDARRGYNTAAVQSVSGAVQKWQNVGELGPIMRCDKMFGYVSGRFLIMNQGSTGSSHNADDAAPGL